MKLAIIFNKNKLSGKLTKFWTGCYAYHVAWVDDEGKYMYDMYKIRRKRPWPYYPEAHILLYNFPEITTKYLEHQLLYDNSKYGTIDYLLFSVRKLFHLFGKSTINAGGVICSEMVNNDAVACGVKTPWNTKNEPPSPCDWHNWLRSSDRESE